jgi:hypothetical protein
VPFEYERIYPLQRPSSIEPPRFQNPEMSATTTQNSHMAVHAEKAIRIRKTSSSIKLLIMPGIL